MEGERGGGGPDPPNRGHRGQLKRRVTLAGSQVQKLVKSADVVKEDLLEALRKVQDEFKIFATYHKSLHETYSDLEAKLSSNYFQAAEAKYLSYVAVAEERLSKLEQGSEDPLHLESSSSEEEEEEGDDGELGTPDLRNENSEPRTPPPHQGTDATDIKALMVEFMSSVNAKLAKFDDFMKTSSQPKGVQLQTSTPLRRGAYTPSRNHVSGLTTINETEDSSADSLRVMQSVAESIRLLAERKEQNHTQTIIRETNKNPKFKMFTFSGESIDYLPFIRAFESQVEAKSEDPAVNLGQLIDHVKDGPLKESLKFCALEGDPAAGYAAAKEILKNKYGRYEDLSQAWVDKIAKIKKIGSVEELSNFISTLGNCQIALRAVGQLAEFETKANLMSLVDKLPRSVRNRWQRRVVDIREECNRGARLADVIRLLDRLYLEKSDPIFGGTLEDSPEVRLAPKTGVYGSSMRTQRVNYTEDHESPERVNALTSRGTERKPFPYACTCCGGQHPMYRCLTFKDMKPCARIQFINSKAACLNCFHPKHAVADCKSPHRCHVCGQKHHTMVHIDGGIAASEAVMEERINSIVATALEKGRVALPVVPVKVLTDRGKMVETYALLDQGSTSTLCTDRLAARVGAQVTPYVTYITTVVGDKMKITSGKTSLKIESHDTNRRYKLDEVITRPTLNLTAKCKAFKEDLEKWPHLRDLKLPTADSADVDLLIGLRHKELLVPDVTLWGPNKVGPFAARTPLGWYVGGPLDDTGSIEDTSHLCYAGQFEGEDTLQDDLARLWRVEGPQPVAEKTEMSPTDQRVITQWKEGLRHDGKNYHLPIPFKDREEEIPNNREEALAWFRSLEKKLLKNPEEGRQHVAGVMSYILKGHAEKVPENQRKGKKGKTRYLPHHMVNHPKKPGKPRIVFNCAAKFFGKSLNDYINSGPDLMNLLIDVLLRFRQDWKALLGDIEGMFNQILVDEEDRDVLRFFFWKDGIIGNEIEEYRMRTHLFGGVWSPSCANFTLQQVARDFGTGFSPSTVKAIKDNFYVDDGLNTDSTDEKAIQKYRELDQLLGRGGFNYTKIASNSRAVLESIPTEKLAKEINLKKLEFNAGEVKAVLGCNWKPKTDMLVYSSDLPAKPNTKRGVLSTLSSVYDPLGLVAPVVVRARVIFQNTCRRKLVWDDHLPTELQELWDQWKESLRDMDLLEFAPCVLPEGVTLDDDLIFDLHIFADSSEAAYGSVGYLLVSQDEWPLGAALLMAKGRLAPLRYMSIPRLELTAAESAVMLEIVLKRALDLNIRSTTFWTDSMIVIWYVANQLKRYKTFVSNKISVITANSTTLQWRHVPTSLNPADLISRGTTPRELAESPLWQHGPPFLMKHPDEWPARVSQPKVEEKLIELKKEEVMNLTIEEYMEVEPESVVASTQMEESEGPNPTERYLCLRGTWHKIKKMLVYWKKIRPWYILKQRGALSEDKIRAIQKPVTYREIQAAEHGICRYLQRDLRDNQGRIRKEYHKLSPVEKDGLVRVGGRLGRADLDPGRKHPVLLPGSSFLEPLVRQVHLQEGHAGPQRVDGELKKRYWITHCKKIIGRIDNTCLTCKRLRVPLCQPRMDDLHERRVVGEERPFANTGIDYFGPLQVKIGRSVHKRYGCLMTCLRTRAIHLELAWSLDMDSCLKAILRFAARRGMPASIDSDNGTNFVGTSKEIKKALGLWRQHTISDEFLKRGCTWNFNPPSASHMGGAWERMIRSVRSILMTLTYDQLLTEESLITSLCVIDYILNNRPITPVSSDARDLTTLTPNHFLRLDTGVQMPVMITDGKDAYRRRWLQVQHVSNIFWRRWRDEYLPTLQPRNKWVKQDRSLAVGDLVVLPETHVPRNCWPMARVVAVHPDEKGIVRIVDIQTRDGQFRRPANKLGLLEGVS